MLARITDSEPPDWSVTVGVVGFLLIRHTPSQLPLFGARVLGQHS